MLRRRVLDDLAAALRGEPDQGCDWAAVINLANQALVTPQLAAALERHPAADALAGELKAFLDEVLGRNRERNARLWRQLIDAVGALNQAGITPAVLKGAALWLWSGASRDRLMTDIDLLVRPEEADAAVIALQQQGFGILQRRTGPLVHVVAELGRPQDVGGLDLHQRPPGPPGLIEAVDFSGRFQEMELEGHRVLAPDAAAQVLHLVLHDQFHDGGFWRGGFDLRHDLDLAQLRPSLRASDRRWLQAACGTKLVRTALEAQLLCSERFVPIGATGGSPSAAARRVQQRWMLQFAYPKLRLPLAALALARHSRDLREHRRANSRAQAARVGAQAIPAKPLLDRVNRLATIMSVRPGKI